MLPPRWLRRAGIAALTVAGLLGMLTIATAWVTVVRRGLRSNLEFAGCAVHYTWNPDRSGAAALDSGWSVSADWNPVPTVTWASIWRRPRAGVHGIGGWSYILIPLAPPTLALAAVSAGLLVLARRASRRAGICPACWYDLRGLPPATIRCPECGHERAKGADERSGEQDSQYHG